MSVKNILDGSIQIGAGGLTPESEVQVASVTATAISSQVINASTSIGTPSVTATSVSAGTYTGNNIEVGTVSAKGWVKTEVIKATQITTSGPIEALSGVSTTNLSATGSITTPALTLGETPVLTQTVSDSNQYIAITYGERDEEVLTAQVHSKVCNINSVQHVLTCQLELKSLSKAIKQMIIPTGLDFSDRTNTKSYNTTVAMINETDLLLGLVHIFARSNVLYAKVVFSETPSYTSIAIKINIVFN